PPTPPAAGAAGATDKLFAAYLDVQRALGAPQQSANPVDPTPVIDAAKALDADGDPASLGAKVRAAAEAMAGKPVAEQRKLFKPLSEAAIALAQSRPPSSAVAAKLYVAFCPMAPGDGARWLQATEAIANPYFATRMKECGTIERTLPTGVAPATGPTTTTATAPAAGGHVH
ncbi:MAG TPA: hypothetical protein VF796_07315, partial [Humisphaera sp.]